MRTLLIMTLTIVFCYCGRKDVNTSNSNVIDIFSPSEGEISKLSDIASDVEYILLRTSGNSLIRSIYDIKTNHDNIYVNTLTDLVCFNKTGAFLYKLDRQGRGPEEYIGIRDFDISVNGDFILVLATGKILIFNIREEGFVFSKSLKLPLSSPSNLDFISPQNSILLTYTSTGVEPLRYLLINLDGDTLNFRPNYYKYQKNEKFIVIIRNENINYIYNNNLYFKEMLSDTVFTLDQSRNFKPYIILDSHGKKPTAQDKSNTKDFNLSKYVRFENIFEVSRYLIYEFSYEKLGQFVFYDKVLNKKFELNARTFLLDDIIGGVNFKPRFCSDGKLYSWVEPLRLKEFVSSNEWGKLKVKNPAKKAELKKLADSLNEFDNPVLISVKVK